MARVSRKQLLKKDEFVESAADFGQWLEEHGSAVLKWVIAVVAVIVMLGAGNAWVQRGRQQAEKALNAAVVKFAKAESDGFPESSLAPVLEELSAAADSGGDSAGGQLARYYQAATLHRMGRTAEAIPLLEQVIASPKTPSTLLGSSQSLLVTAFIETGATDRAIETLQGLIDQPQPGLPAEQALMRLGHLYDSQGKAELARTTFQRIADEFGRTSAGAQATAWLAR